MARGRVCLALERDPVTAGRLFIALLPAQGLVTPEPLAYDLVLDGLGCVQVTVIGPSHKTAVRLAETPRPADEVSFALSGDLGRLAALVASGSLRRRLSRRRARVTYDRAAASALLALVRTPISLEQLIAAGVRMDPWLTLTLASMMIDPAWTRGERFSIAFQEPSGMLQAPTSMCVTAAGPPSARPSSAKILRARSSAPRSECSRFWGDLRAGARLRGETRPLALLQHWIERAQSG